MDSQSSILDRVDAEALVGTWRRFGPTGPVYEIRSVSERYGNEVLRMKVQVVSTGETFDYKLSDLLQDPREN